MTLRYYGSLKNSIVKQGVFQPQAPVPNPRVSTPLDPLAGSAGGLGGRGRWRAPGVGLHGAIRTAGEAGERGSRDRMSPGSPRGWFYRVTKRDRNMAGPREEAVSGKATEERRKDYPARDRGWVALAWVGRKKTFQTVARRPIVSGVVQSLRCMTQSLRFMRPGTCTIRSR